MSPFGLCGDLRREGSIYVREVWRDGGHRDALLMLSAHYLYIITSDGISYICIVNNTQNGELSFKAWNLIVVGSFRLIPSLGFNDIKVLEKSHYLMVGGRTEKLPGAVQARNL